MAVEIKTLNIYLILALAHYATTKKRLPHLPHPHYISMHAHS